MSYDGTALQKLLGEINDDYVIMMSFKMRISEQKQEG